MSQDVAALGFQVDSSEIQYANTHLDTMRASSEATGRAVGQFGLSTSQARASLQAFRQTAQALNQDLGATGTVLDVVMAKLDQTRQVLRNSAEAMKDFSTIRVQVEAVGLAFGQTSTGVEAYYRQSQLLGLSTAQTVTSLQRVSEALTNQTMMGQQTRRVMEDYGVALTDTSGKAVAADVALARFTERMRTYADTAQKFRTAALVLGPLDPDSYGKVNDPGYISIDQKKREVAQSHYTTEIADRTRNASLIEKDVNRNAAELADLGGRYNLGYNSATGLSASQRGELRSKAGLSSEDSAQSPDSEKLAMLRVLAKDPSSQMATDGRGYFGAVGDSLKIGSIGRAYTHVASGEAGANAQEIRAQYDLDRQNNGFFSAVGSNFTSSAQNLFNNYKPQAPIQDQRERSPVDKFLEDQTVAAKLAGYGDKGLTTRQRADEGLKDFQVDKRTNRPLDGASAEAMRALQGVHGTDEGEARFFQVKGSLQRARDGAMVPGQDELDQNAQAAYLLRLPREQRGQAEAAMKFAGTQGANVPGMLAGNPSFDQLMDPNAEIPNGMTPAQRKSFGQINQGTIANRTAVDAQAFQVQLDLQVKQTAAAKDGAAAVENLVTQTNAYNQVLAAGKSEDEAKLARSNAQLLLDERRRTQAVELLSGMERANKVEADRIALMAGAGSDPSARAKAATNNQILTDYEKALLTNPTLSYADFTKASGQQVTTKVQGSANDTVVSAQQELKTSQDAVGVAKQRADIGAKMASDQKVDFEFAERRGQLEATGNALDLAALDAKIAKTKDLRTEIAALNQEAKNFQIGRDLQDGANFDNTAAGIADPQQRRLLMLQRQNVMDNRGARAPGGGTGTAYDSMRDGIATEYGVDPEAIRRLNGVEGVRNADGSWKNSNVAGSHATGPMQVQPGTFNAMQKKYGFKGSIDDDEANTRAGTLYYKEQLETSQGKLGPAYLKYHDGPGYTVASADALKSGASIAAGYTGTSLPGMAARAGATVNADDATANLGVANSRDAFSERQRVTEAARGQSPGNAARTRAGYLDPNGNPITATNARDQAQAGVLSGQRDQAAQQEQAAQQTIDGQTKVAGAYDKSRAAVAAATRTNQIDQEVRQAGDGIVNVQIRNEQELAKAANAVALTIGQDGQKTREATTDQIGLADAWKKGTQAAGEYQRALELAPLEREITSLKEQGKSVDGLTASLIKLRAAKEAEAGAAQDTQVARGIATDKNRNALTEADNALGPMATQRMRDRTRAEGQAAQDVANMPSGTSQDAKKAYLDQAAYNETLKETTSRMEEFRSGYQGMMGSALSTIDGAILNGGKLKDVVGSVTKEWAGMLLKMAEKPLMDAGSNWLGSLLKLGSSALSASSGVPDVGGIGAAGPGASSLGGALTAANASGNAFMGGVKMFASGGVLDRPTRFFSAGGQANVAGEAGNEALLPLRRMANGDMGVAAGSGGSGGGVTVHAPITINGGGGGQGGKMDPAMLASMQKQLTESVRVAVLHGIADEKRPGGSLY